MDVKIINNLYQKKFYSYFLIIFLLKFKENKCLEFLSLWKEYN
jgi:hypothetical protein